MTPTQKTELLKALEEGNDVRIVTIALQVAAQAARERRQDEAIAIRTLIDDHQSRDYAEKEYKKLRLQLVAPLFMLIPGETLEWSAAQAVARADALIKACATIPVPK